MMVSRLKNRNDIKNDGSGIKRMVGIDPGIWKNKFEPRIDSNTKQLTNKTRVLFYLIKRTHKPLKFNQ